ncbi:MAG: hypothetical protein KAR42_15075 [candidate division Zixibacteria bacterium]|nr:hypothetical protein [candidate division Zixibacteria bacterium]
MNFETVKDSIVNNILAPAEAGRFRTVGFQRQSINADEVEDNLRLVQIYFSRGDFSKRAGRNTGPVQHDVTYRVELIVSKAAGGDLATLDNPSSTPSQLATALVGFSESSALADASLDELAGIIYQILMDGLNYDLGVTKYTVSNRWIDNIQKNEPTSRGSLLVLTGSMDLSCRMVEEITGDVGAEVPGVYDTELDIDGDDVEKTGVTIDNT